MIFRKGGGLRGSIGFSYAVCILLRSFKSCLKKKNGGHLKPGNILPVTKSTLRPISSGVVLSGVALSLNTLCALSIDHADRLCRVQIFVLREFYTFLSHAVATMIHGCISLSSWCLLMVVCLFLAVPWGCLLFVIVVFPDHAHILFLGSEYPLNLLYMNHKTGDLETWFASLDSK